MKRRLDVRFLVVLLLAAAALGGGGHFLHGYQVKRNAGYLDDRARKAEEGKDVPAALNYLSRYLAVRPDDAGARGRYGILLAKVAKTEREKEQAFVTLERALREDPGLADVREVSAELAIALARYADARGHLNTLLGDRPNDERLTNLLGLSLEASGQLAEAAELFEQAIKYDRGRVEFYARLAALYRRTDQADKADQVMGRLLEANPDSIRARLAAVRYHREHGRLAQAQAELARLRAGRDADDKDVLLASADVALAGGNLDAARDVFRRGIEKHPGEPQFYIGLADVTLRKGQRAEAASFLRKAVEVAPERSPYVWAIADLLITADEPREAGKLVDRLDTEGASAAPVEYLRARLWLGEGRARKAELALQNCRREFARNPNFGVMTELLLATCYERLDKPDLRLAACKLALKLNPTAVTVRRAHADALLADGKLDEAVRQYQGLLDQDQEVRLVLARIGVWQQARRPAPEQDWTGVAALLDEAPAAQKAAPGYTQVRAEMLQARGKPAEAIRLIEAARDKDPTELSYWLTLAFAAARTGAPKDGLAVLDQAAIRIGDKVPVRLARAALLAGPPPDAAGLRALEAGADTFPDSERNQLLSGLAEAQVRAKSPTDAERLLRELAGRLPGDPGVLGRLLDVVAAKEDLAGIGEVAGKLRHPDAEGEDGVLWRFAEAYQHWLAHLKDPGHTAGDIRHARTRLAEAAERRPQWFRVPLLEGQIADREGQVDLAIEKYRQAVRLGARNPDVVRRAAVLMMARRRHDDVRQLLEEVRGGSQVTPQKLAAVESALALALGGDAERTVELAERTAPAVSADYRDHLWRGQVFWSVGRTKDAEASFRRAVELGRAAPDAWVGLVVFLRRTDRLAEAKAEVEAAGKAVAADQRAQVLAPCLEVVGERAEAEKHYVELVRQAPADPAALRGAATFYLNGGEMAKAKPYFDALIASQGPAAAESRWWARRVFALALTASGDYKLGTEALGLLEKNLQENPGNPEDVRARALALAVRPGGRRQSIKDLEASFAKLRPSPGEEFFLARLYELDGDWPKASTLLAGLLAGRGGDNLDFLAYYIRALVNHHDDAAAVAWLAKLEAKEKNPLAPRSAELRSRVLIRQDRKADAAALLKRYAQEAVASQKNPAELARVGLLMADLKLTAEAEDMLRQYVAAVQAKQPAAVLVLADFLARHDRVAEALTICSDALTNKVNPDLIGRHAVGVVRVGDATADLAARAEAVVQRAIQAQPQSVDLQISFAELRDAQKRYDEAKQVYRALLKRGSRDQIDVVLNNLAWLLAVQEGNTAEAMTVVNQAIEAQGPDGNLLDTRGVISMLAGDTARAIADLTEAVAQQPLAVRYFHLAQAYHKAGNAVEARRAMRKARELELSKKDLHALEWKDYEPMLALLGGT